MAINGPIVSLCVFSGGLPETDSDAAAEALRAAGFGVGRLPLALKAIVEADGEPGDDFIEISRDDTSREKMEAEANRIVAAFGGAVEVGILTIAEMFAPPRPPSRRNDNVVRLVSRRQGYFSGGEVK